MFHNHTALYWRHMSSGCWALFPEWSPYFSKSCPRPSGLYSPSQLATAPLKFLWRSIQQSIRLRFKGNLLGQTSSKLVVVVNIDWQLQLDRLLDSHFEFRTSEPHQPFGMVTIDSVYELVIVLSNGTIADSPLPTTYGLATIHALQSDKQRNDIVAKARPNGRQKLVHMLPVA